MKVWLILPFVVACATDPALDEVAQQAGTSTQGTSTQGTSTQGTSTQGTSTQGTSTGGIAASDAFVVGTDLHYWRAQNHGWLEVSARSTCLWDASRTTKRNCSSRDLATETSPLVGSTWDTVFVGDAGSRDHLSLQVARVYNDTSVAMFDLRGFPAAPGALVDCDNPGNCRRNTDLFLYDVNVINHDGSKTSLCPAGQAAMALAGYWDRAGMFHGDANKFSFVCTNGTIAKCVRWGYRPWMSAFKNGQTFGFPTSLAGYHQSCVHAAMADYCGDGFSFTQNGTVVDVYDYASDKGFIQQRRGFVTPADEDHSMVWEGGFDNKGAYYLDHIRYREREPELQTRCGSLWPYSNDVLKMERAGEPVGPFVQIDSTPSCAHTHLMTGRALHPGCSTCIDHVRDVVPHCTDPTSPEGWDDACVAASKQYPTHAYCNTSDLPPHSECATGRGLDIYASGCTLAMSLRGYASCFDTTSATAWSSACIAAANAICKGGQEHTDALRSYGFCNQPLQRIGTASL